MISQIKWIGRRHWREYSKYIHIFQLVYLLLENWYLLCSQCASLPWKKEFQFVANLTAETFWPIVGIDSKLRKGSKKVLSSVKLFKTLTGFWRPVRKLHFYIFFLVEPVHGSTCFISYNIGEIVWNFRSSFSSKTLTIIIWVLCLWTHIKESNFMRAHILMKIHIVFAMDQVHMWLH